MDVALAQGRVCDLVQDGDDLVSGCDPVLVAGLGVACWAGGDDGIQDVGRDGGLVGGHGGCQGLGALSDEDVVGVLPCGEGDDVDAGVSDLLGELEGCS